MAHGGLRITETDGREAFLGGLGGQLHLILVELGADGQHRAVVDVEMQVTYLAARLVITFHELLGVQAEGACHTAQLLIAAELVHVDVTFAFKPAEIRGTKIREQVRAFQRPHLLAMFQHAFEPVVRGESRRLLA